MIKNCPLKAGDRVVMCGVLREGENASEMHKNGVGIKEALTTLGVTVVATIIDKYPIDSEEERKQLRLITALIDEHDAFMLLFGADDGFLVIDKNPHYRGDKNSWK